MQIQSKIEQICVHIHCSTSTNIMNFFISVLENKIEGKKKLFNYLSFTVPKGPSPRPIT